MIRRKLALVGPATWYPLVAPLQDAMGVYGIDADLHVYGFGDDVVVLSAQHAAFLASAPDAVLFVQDGRTLFRNWLRNPRRNGDPAESGRAAARFLIESIGRLRCKLQNTTWSVATLAPPVPNSGDAVGNAMATDPFSIATSEFNREIWQGWKDHVLEVFDGGRVQAEWGTRTLFDARLDQLARFPASGAGITILAERVAAHWAALAGRMKKAVVLDCDNTLWGGIVGEDGVDGIRLGDDGIGRAYTMFQEHLLALEANGTLLTLCSRNNPEDVESVFAQRPEMVIPRSRIAAAQIGWQAKSDAIVNLANQLGLGLDSFVFIDDNPREREQVRHELPMVVVPEFPDDPADMPAFAAELGWRWFQRNRLAEEDVRKTNQYRARAATEELRRRSESPEEFWRSLDMTACIHVNDPQLVFRMAQLTQKTNQFNLTLQRYTEAEIRSMLPRRELFAGSLADRFGDHGVVALLVAENVVAAWRIDVLLMSCRVLGRGFEQAFARAVIQYLRGKQRLPIEAHYLAGERNQQVRDYFSDLGFQSIPCDVEGQKAYRLSVNRDVTSPGSYVSIEWKVKNER